METMVADTASFRGFVDDPMRQFPYEVIIAKVVNNSVSYLSNYVTIDKGREDGVSADMGVVSEGGVVGIVSTVADHYSVVIPLLNPKFRLSCKVLGSSYFGSMSWDGRSTRYAQLEELPRHVEFKEGDTIVTSGFSAIFPEGILVGNVSSFERQRNDNFYSLTVKLATDFHRLSSVMIIKNYRQKEQMQIEQEAKSNG
jgi:rod shape-determining protein MreC